MATVEQTLLQQIYNELKKSNRYTKDDDLNNRISRSRSDSSIITNREIVNDFKRLEREINYNIAAMRKSRTDILTSIKSFVVPVASMNRQFEQYKKNFQDYIRSNSKEFKDAANQTVDAFQDLIRNGKGFSSELSSLTRMQKYYSSTLHSFSDNLKNIKIEQTLENELPKMRKDRDEIQNRIEKNRKSKKSTTELEKELESLTDKIKETESQFSGIKKSNEEYKNNYKKFIGEVTFLHKKGIPVLSGIDKKFLDYETFMKSKNHEQEQILTRLTKNIKGISAGVSGFESLLNGYRTTIENSKKDFINASKRFIINLATVSANQLIRDYNATRKYNVTSIAPLQAANMGMSQEDLSTLIGQNKTFLRVAGQGDQNRLINSGEFKELQNVAKAFGVYGKDAADLAAKFGTLQTQIGGSVDPTSIKAVMQDFKKLSDITELTADELIDLTQELNRNGTITLLNAKNVNKTEQERQAAIRNEIDQRYRLNKYMGHSIEYLKQQQQLQTNARYASVEEIFKNIIGAEFSVSNYERISGNKLSDREKSLYSAFTSDQTAGFDAATREEAEKIFRRISLTTQQRAMSNQLRIGEDIMGGDSFIKAATRNIEDRFMLQLQSQFGEKFGSNILEEEATADRIAKGLSGIDYLQKSFMESPIFGKNSGLELLNIKFENVGKATDPLTQKFNALGESATTLKEKFSGIMSNPLGQAGGSLVGLGSSALNLLAASRLAKALGVTGKGLRGGSSLIGGGSIGAMASTSVGSLATGGIAGLATLVSAVLGAGAVGAAVGTLAEKTSRTFYEGSDKQRYIKATTDLSTISGTIKDTLAQFGLIKTPNLTTNQLDSLEDRTKNIRNDKSTITLLDSYLKQYGDSTKNDQIAFVRLLTKENNIGLLDRIKDSDVGNDYLKSLGASDELVKRISSSSIQNYIKDALALEGGSSDIAVQTLQEMNANIKKLTDKTVKDIDSKDERDKLGKINDIKRSQFIDSQLSRVELIRKSIGYDGT